MQDNLKVRTAASTSICDDAFTGLSPLSSGKSEARGLSGMFTDIWEAHLYLAGRGGSGTLSPTTQGREVNLVLSSAPFTNSASAFLFAKAHRPHVVTTGDVSIPCRLSSLSNARSSSPSPSPEPPSQVLGKRQRGPAPIERPVTRRSTTPPSRLVSL